MVDLNTVLVEPDRSIREVMEGIGKALGLALVVDEDRRLLGTVTDGDIRRAILAGVDLDQPVQVLLEEQRRPHQHTEPLTAPVGTPVGRLLQIMAETTLRHIPLVNDAGQVEDVAVLNELVTEYELPLSAVVMAGGQGNRLRPLTEDVPKPMLPLGDRPLLAHLVDQLSATGIRRLNITTHYKGHLIEEHFGDGSEFGIKIGYINEQKPLGTAGSLSLLEPSDDPLLVINGDIVSQVDARAMLDFHLEHRADMTVAVRQQEFPIPYGVVEIDGVEITAISEKPTLHHLINAGIYLLGPQACARVPAGRHYDMTDLIHDLVTDGSKVVGFPIQGSWTDIGRQEDYERAQIEIDEERTKT